MGVCNCSMFCCMLLYVPCSFAIILIGKRELVALLGVSSWCLVIVVWLFLAVPWVCLQFVRGYFLIILTYHFYRWSVLDKQVHIPPSNRGGGGVLVACIYSKDQLYTRNKQLSIRPLRVFLAFTNQLLLFSFLPLTA